MSVDKRRIIARRYRYGKPLPASSGRQLYLGFDQQLHRSVVVEAIPAAKAGGVQAMQERKAAITAAIQLNDRHLIAVYDAIVENDTLYIISEYAPGSTLRAIIDGEAPFHPIDVAILLEQVANGVNAISNAGLPLPALTPEEIVVDDAGLVRLMPAGQPAVEIAGSHLYPSAPEEDGDEALTSPALVFRLGLIAYEMLTGQQSDPEQLTPPSQVQPTLPIAVDAIIRNALFADPGGRYDSPREFAQAMALWQEPVRPAMTLITMPPAPFSTGRKENDDAELHTGWERIEESYLPQTTPEPLPGRSRLMAWLASGAVILGLITAIIYGSQRLSGDPSPDPAPTSQAGGEQAQPTEVNVPELAGMTYTEARATLTALGLRIDMAGEPLTSVNSRIASQEPPPGEEVALGATITITIDPASSPVDLVAMELTGKLAQDAITELEGAGLEAGLVVTPSDAAQEGVVLRHEPALQAPPGTTVQLFVGAGDNVQIPSSIQGEPLDEAVRILEEVGIAVEQQIGVSAATIESFNIDLASAGFVDRDVVGIQGGANGFGEWVEPGVNVTLVYYDASLDNGDQP